MALDSATKVVSKIEYGLRGSKIGLVFKGATIIDGIEGNLKGLAEHQQYMRQDIVTCVPEDGELRISLYVPSDDAEHSGMVISRGDAKPLNVFTGPTERTVAPNSLPNTRKVFPLMPGDIIQVQTMPDRPLVEIEVEAYC